MSFLHMPFVYDDGGRKASGRKGKAGDCVCRAVAIATGRPYHELYALLADGNAGQRGGGKRSARNGIQTKRKWFKDEMQRLGFRWVPTMTIGSGCKVHLVPGELPAGRLVVSVSRHYTAVIDGVVRDTHDPQRATHVMEADGTTRIAEGCVYSYRCVYGYWIFETNT